MANENKGEVKKDLGGGETLTHGARDMDVTLTGGAGGSNVSGVITESLEAGAGLDAVTKTHLGSGTGDLVDKVDWEVGDVIDGKYEVIGELGRGGMGTVYKAHHRGWNLDLAVKMPLAQLVADEASKARFIREAQTWVDLGLHPNIVQCWYVRGLRGLLRIFVDQVKGRSFKRWIERGKVQPGHQNIWQFLMMQT